MTKTYDVLIKGGLVVSGSGIRRADVGIEGERVASVESKLPIAFMKAGSALGDLPW